MCNFTKKSFKPVCLGIIAFSIAVLIIACASQNKANIDTGGDTKLITDIITSEDAESTVVTVKGSHELTYTAVKQVFPLGVLLHFPETGLDNIKTVHFPPQNDAITSIKANQIEEDGLVSRIFIALKKDLPYNITPDDNGFHISFPKNGVPIADTATQESQVATDAEETRSEPENIVVSPATKITSVTATPLKRNVVVNVKADGKIDDFKSFPIDNPPRIVYDLYNLKSPYSGEQRLAVNSDWVSKIRHFGYPNKIRMVLETQKDYLSKFLAKPVENGLLIYVGTLPESTNKQTSISEPVLVASLGNPEALSTSSDQAEQPVTAEAKTPEITEDKEIIVAQDPAPVKSEEQISSDEQESERLVVAQSEASDTKEPESTAANDKPAWLNRIDFSSEEAGKSAVIIGTTRPVEYEVLKIEDRILQLKLTGTRLPEYRKRALITTRFQSAVDRVTPTQPPKTNDTVIAIELRESVPYIVEQTNNIIKVNFSASSIPPKPYEDAKLPAWKRVLAEPGTQVKPISQVAQKTTSPKASPEEQEKLRPASELMTLDQRVVRSTPTQKYTGEKIALDFYDTDIKNVFRIIREISGKNFAIDKNVTGKVTLTLDKPVPWDQVLDLVLKMNQLGLTMEGDIIRIATLSTLAQEEKLRQEKLKAEKTALNQQKALEPLITTYIPINYSNAETEILPHVKPILTTNRGKVSVDTRNNQLILTDTVEKVAQARQIVREIDRVTPQVIIEARVVEANTNFARELGFDWGTISVGPLDIGDAQLDFSLLASNLPPSAPTGEVGFNLQKLTGTPFSIVDAKLQVSEREGRTNIISSPKIVTLDNKKAKIKQGLEVAFLERDDSGGSTVKFKEVDLLLEVTPNITPDDRISMQVFLTKNEVVDPTVSPPTLSTNEAETELLVDDGDTIVIGGIVKSSVSIAESGIPGLRKIGVLGWLFKSQSKLDTKNELLIFITPRIVKLAQKKQSI